MVLRITFGVVALLVFSGSGRAQGVLVAPPVRPITAIERVCIISIDGLRPDRALLADMPNLRSLLKAGAYTFWARTTPQSITLPSHVSMVTGVTPQKHGVEWNRDLPFAEPVYPAVPTIFEMAKQAGYTTAVVAGKSKFSVFDKPGVLSWVEIAKSPKSSNADVTAAAVKLIEEHRPQLLFIHYPDVDSAGHSKGWGSEEQFAVIEKTDTELGQILAAMDRADIRKNTLLIISADHGGAGLTHGPDDPRSRHIPWICVGPEVRRHFDLTQIAPLQVNTEDTAATACYALGLRIPPYFDGKPVMAAFETH